MELPYRYEKAAFTAGCFWDVEAEFRKTDRVLDTIAGYTGGSCSDPQYEEVESAKTGHAEAVGIVFDPGLVS